MERRRIVILEDDPMTRGMLAGVLEAADFDVVTASTGSDARRLCALVDPDALLVDIDLGVGINGIDVADALLAEYPHLTVLFLTNLPDPRFAGRDSTSLPSGVGYLRKEKLVTPGLLVAALEAVLRGEVSAEFRHDLDPDRPFTQLSKNQIAVLRMVAQGRSNQEIAAARGITVRAVHGMLSRTFRALGILEDSDGNARVTAARDYMLAAGIPLA
jgi:DNA-binding NarL/FixJ family response regulator